jgi:hypothetical protein
VLLFLGAVAGVAEAQPTTQLTVRVRDQNGNNISQATVCMAQGSQAWSRPTTGIEAAAVLTGLPAGTYTRHVIKSNFQTKSQSVNLSGTQEVTVTLQPGDSTLPAGVNCQVGGAPTTLPPITITSFKVEVERANLITDLPADFKVTSPPVTHLRLRATFDRRPAFFRIIEDSGYAYTTPLQNLRTRPWGPLPPSAPVAPFIYLFPLDLARPYGTRTVHLQVSSVASEDAASQIKSVSVILTPAQLRTTIYAGPALQGILDRAQQEGYGPLKLKTYQVIPDPLCPQGSTPGLVFDSRGRAFIDALTRNPSTLTEKAEFRAFAGPPLMPFWKITDLVMHHDWGQPSVVSGYTMVNNPSQPPLQAPERTIRIERTFQYECFSGTAGSYLPPPAPPLPTFFAATVVGPDGRDPRDAFPPRGPTAGGPVAPPPLFPIPPGTFRP